MEINPKIGQLITDGYCRNEGDRRGYDEEWYEFSPDELDTLISLIVQECALVCKTGAVSNIDYNTGRLHCYSDIINHFGVKK